MSTNTSMYNRAEIIDRNFLNFVKEGRLPMGRTRLSLAEAGLSQIELIDLFESQVISRRLDLRARELKNLNQCFYTIGSSGHEGNAAVAKALRVTDMAFLHYRSGAFMVQRAKEHPGSTPLYNGLLSLVASSDDPISGGRHRVYGSVSLTVPPQTSTIASHLPKAVGAALSISRARDLNIKSRLPSDSIILCSFGDASLNHASAQAAINTASSISYRSIPLPLLFLCEDNGVGISVPTPQRWVQDSISARPGIRYFYADGLNLLHAYQVSKEAEHYVRTQKKPAFLHLGTVRLLGHAGSDPEWSYHAWDKIEQAEQDDPLLHTARLLIENQILTRDEIIHIYEATRERALHISNYVVTRPKLRTREEVRASVVACKYPNTPPENPSDDERRQVFGKDFDKLSTSPQHLAKLVNYALTDILLKYKNTLIFGEDVAQKGGVYNVTDGLYKKFGPRRVFNSILDETSILGNAIGLAHNGFVPIPEIQFLAYVHNAEDQIRGEAATLSFFSQGQYTNPMVIRIAGLPYQKGFGGHFHNDNSLAVFRDIPGLILAVPSNGQDAVKMLRTAVREAHTQGRVVVFVEPIALYMTKDLFVEGDKKWSFNYPALSEELSLGELGIHGSGQDLCILTYGNGVYYSLQAQKDLLDQYKIKSTIIDLRWLAPLNWDAISKETSKFKNVLIVDECRKTGSLSEGLVAGIVERVKPIPNICVEAADDCFIPLGVASQAGLPSRQSIVQAALKMLGVKV